jgi:hypothetical protein
VTRRAAFFAPTLATLLGLTLTATCLSLPLAATAAPTALGVDAARSRAGTLLEALRLRNGRQLFDSLSDDVRRFTTPEAVQRRIDQLPPFQSATVLDVLSGVDDSTIKAELVSPGQRRPLTLVIDPNGQLIAWRFDSSQLPIEQVARDFVGELAAGQVVSARSRLSLQMQEEMTPGAIQARWQGLERLVGNFQEIKGTVVANAGGDQQLVLVTTRFARLTDNLFVIFDRKNRIIGIDFPIDGR